MSPINEAIVSLLERFPNKRMVIHRRARLCVEPKLEEYLAFSENERVLLKEFADDEEKPKWTDLALNIPDVTYFHAAGAPRYIFRAVKPEVYVEVDIREPRLDEDSTLKSFGILDVSKLDPFIIRNVEQHAQGVDEIIKVGQK